MYRKNEKTRDFSLKTETGSLKTACTAIRFLERRGAQKFQHESPKPVVELNLLARGQGGPHAVAWGHKHG
jgi:hypothetical protein